MQISPENYWREVWHCDCVPGRGNGIMKRQNHYMAIEDGSTLRLFECLHCGEKCYAGLDAQRRVKVVPYEDVLE